MSNTEIDELRLLFVRAPAGTALVELGKDVENRSRALPKTIMAQLPVRCLVIQSSHRMTPADREYIAARAGKEASEAAAYPRSAVMGMIRITGCAQASDSKWYNGGADWAWLVDEPVSFGTVVGTGIGSYQSPFVRLGRHAQRDQIVAEYGEQIRAVMNPT